MIFQYFCKTFVPRSEGPPLSNHCEVIILSTKSLVRLKDQVKSLEYKMFIHEIDFHGLFNGTFKVMFLQSLT